MRACLVGLLIASLGASVRADEVDEFIKAEMDRQKIPGLSLAIVRNGTLERAKGYGLANVEHGVAVKPQTVFQSGSVGKQFTATAVMMLVEEGRLGLDDPIKKFFPGAPRKWRPITVRHLLTHTSGIKDWENKDLDYRRDYTEEELTKVAMTLPLDFAPGTQWSYSNTGYVLLGIIIHKVTGRFYGDVLKERVFDPLGMSARIISESDIVGDRAAGYRLDKGVLKNQEWVSPSLNTTADGSLYFTTLDLVKWDGALRGETLLKRSSLEAMWTPVRLAGGGTYPYGFGWSVVDQRGRPLIEHGGSWQGFRAAIARYVDEALTVIVLTNLAEAQPESIAHSVAGLVEPSLRIPWPKDAGLRDDPRLKDRVLDVLGAWAAGKHSTAMGPGLRAVSTNTEREKAGRKRVVDLLSKRTAFNLLAEDDVGSRGLRRRGEAVSRIVHWGLVTPEKGYAVWFYMGADGIVVDFDLEPR